MFDPEVWGTVADWAGSLLTGLSVLAAVVIYYFDRRRERRAQAGSVVVWLHPHEHGPPAIKVSNLSDQPVFDHGWIILSKPKDEIAAKDPKGEFIGPFDWPTDDDLPFRESGTFINYHDGSEVHLGKGESVEYQPTLRFAPWLFDYFASFRDATGKHWVIDATKRRPVGWNRMRQLRQLRVIPHTE